MNRKLFNIVVFCVLAFVFSSCNVNSDVSNIAIPKKVSHIEFWNGGTMIFNANNAMIEIRRISQSRVVGHDVVWVQYIINNETVIIDSESLSILFRE